MANRKSMHPVVEELRNESPTISSPLRRRSIIAKKTQPTNLEVNDDEAERRLRRLEKNQPPVARVSDRRRSLSVSITGQMSFPQMTERITQCIKLNAENKINMKNAFNLELIDFMSYMIKKQDTNMSNLQAASTSLDVSSKIYGFRVDGVHSDILKMMGGMDKQEKENRENQEGTTRNVDDPGNTEEEGQAKPKKKRRNKQTILVSSESLKGKPETTSPASLMIGGTDSPTTDMLCLAILPFHANTNIYLHLYDDVLLDTVDSNAELTINDTPLPCPKIENLQNLEICESFANFEFLGWSASEDLNRSMTNSENSNNDVHFDLDASLPADDRPTNFATSYYDLMDDADENVEGCRRISGQEANIVDFREVVQASMQKKNLEYSYFHSSLDIQWAGPSHWKIRFANKNLGSSKVIGCGQVARRERKELLIPQNDEMDAVFRSKFTRGKDKQLRLQTKTPKNSWSEERITMPPDIHYDPMKCCTYYFRPKTIKKFPHDENANATHISDDMSDYNYNNELDTTDYCPNVLDNDNPAGNDVFENGAESGEDLTAGTQAFTGDNLVEAPKVLGKIFLPYSQRAKRIDMKQLKKCIWTSLSSSLGGDKENVNHREKTTQENVDKITGMKTFSDIYSNLPKVLSKVNAEALSLPLAFLSLLHIANEKTLAIESTSDLSDLIVRQG